VVISVSMMAGFGIADFRWLMIAREIRRATMPTAYGRAGEQAAAATSRREQATAALRANEAHSHGS